MFNYDRHYSEMLNRLSESVYEGMMRSREETRNFMCSATGQQMLMEASRKCRRRQLVDELDMLKEP